MTGLFQGLQLVGKLTERRLSLKVQEIFFPFWSQQPTIIPGEFVFLKINAFYFGKQLIVARCPSVHHFAVMDVSSFFALAHESRAHKILHPQDIAWKCGHAKMKDLRAAHNNFRSVFFSCSTFQVPARAGIVPSTHNYGLVAYHSSTSTDTSTSTSNSTCSLLRSPQLQERDLRNCILDLQRVQNHGSKLIFPMSYGKKTVLMLALTQGSGQKVWNYTHVFYTNHVMDVVVFLDFP